MTLNTVVEPSQSPGFMVCSLPIIGVNKEQSITHSAERQGARLTWMDIILEGSA